MTIQLGNHNAQYSVISTLGTTILNTGQGSPGVGVGVSIPGAIFSAVPMGLGTATGTFTAGAPSINIYDIIPQQGSVVTSTNLLLSGTATTLGTTSTLYYSCSGAASLAARYRGALVAVTANSQGTGGTWNVFWD